MQNSINSSASRTSVLSDVSVGGGGGYQRGPRVKKRETEQRKVEERKEQENEEDDEGLQFAIINGVSFSSNGVDPRDAIHQKHSEIKGIRISVEQLFNKARPSRRRQKTPERRGFLISSDTDSFIHSGEFRRRVYSPPSPRMRQDESKQRSSNNAAHILQKLFPSAQPEISKVHVQSSILNNSPNRLSSATHGREPTLGSSKRPSALTASSVRFSGPKSKSILCRNFEATGSCHYGSRCKFFHR